MQPHVIDPSAYVVDLISEPARISPAPGFTWPYQQNYIPGQVMIDFTSGTYQEFVALGVYVNPIAPFTFTINDNLLTPLSLLDMSGDTPVPVQYQVSGNTYTVSESYAGQVLNASYFANRCPQTIIQAMLLLIGHFYQNRSASTEANLKEVPLAVDALLAGESFESFGI